MFGKPSQDDGNAADIWRPHAPGRRNRDALADSEPEEFPPPFRRKPFSWLLAKLRILRPDSEKAGQNELEEGDFAEQTLLVRKALKRIDDAGFYTLDAVRQLAVKHFRQKSEAFAGIAEDLRKLLISGRLSTEKRPEAVEERSRALDVASRARLAEGMFKNRGMTDRLEKLMEGKRHPFPAYVLPSRKAVGYLFQFFRECGFLDSPAPVRYLIRDRLLTTVLVNTVKDVQDEEARKALRDGRYEDERSHFFYHAVRSEIGGRGVRLRYELLERAEKLPDLIPGAVYTTYIYDEPYLKKGVFVIYPRRPNDPARVKFLTRWESPVTRQVPGELNGSVKAGHNQATASRAGAFVEEQKGYIFDQGFDFYIFLFGPDAYRSPPSSERTRRISTIYVDGSSRSGAVMNKITGSIIAFDSGPKGEIMFQRVVMYRYGHAFEDMNTERLDDFVDKVLAESRRFDINDPLELTREERAYREIFMDLGFEATEVKDPEDDRRRLEVRRIVQPISDQSPMEIIFDR